MRGLRRVVIALAGAALVAALGCGPGQNRHTDAGDGDADADHDTDADMDDDGDGDSDALRCVDQDGDGYGPGCLLGPDCDDTDGSRWGLETGCPCDQGDPAMACRSIERDPDYGMCQRGTRSCVGGEWGECEWTETYESRSRDPVPPDDGAEAEKVLGDPVHCSRTCDQGCAHVVTSPSSPDLVDPAVTSTNLYYDTLVRPPAVVLVDLEEDGVFRRAIEAWCDGPVVWWALEHMIEVPGGSTGDPSVRIRARVADSQEELEALGTEGFHLVVECPDGACEQPETPIDRQVPGSANLRDALGGTEQATHRWLELEVVLSAGGGEVSPRFQAVLAYYFCGPDV